jgi:hypothetical protein
MVHAPRSLDLSLLARTDPWAAQVGVWLNERGGDPARLAWDEFAAGAPRLLAYYPRDVALRSGVVRLHELFTRSVPPSAPRSWKEALAVALPSSPPRQGRATAYGGVDDRLQPVPLAARTLGIEAGLAVRNSTAHEVGIHAA